MSYSHRISDARNCGAVTVQQGQDFVTINGKQAPIIGNVCMDMIMVNVTDINCAEGDEVIVFGTHPSAVEFAKTANTISYEIITAISQRIKRIIIK